MLAALEDGPISAQELSGLVGISEKEVYGHLEHIRSSLHRAGRRLMIEPAECRSCGFVFSKRERIKGPGKCPACRGSSIHDPLYMTDRVV